MDRRTSRHVYIDSAFETDQEFTMVGLLLYMVAEIVETVEIF